MGRGSQRLATSVALAICPRMIWRADMQSAWVTSIGAFQSVVEGTGLEPV
jgi:hypothetical protein